MSRRATSGRWLKSVRYMAGTTLIFQTSARRRTAGSGEAAVAASAACSMRPVNGMASARNRIRRASEETFTPCSFMNLGLRRDGGAGGEEEGRDGKDSSHHTRTRSAGERWSAWPGRTSKAGYQASRFRTVSARYREGA